MARLAAYALLTGLFARVSSLSLMFINPPTFDWPEDFSSSPKYKEGDTVNVSWTPNEDGGRLSLTLSQRGETVPTIGSAEFLMQNAASATSYSWVVGTGKNLTKSNLFFLSIFRGDSSGANSQSFFIEEDPGEEDFGGGNDLSSSLLVSSTSTLDGASTAASTSAPESTRTSTWASIPTGSNLPSVETNESNTPNQKMLHDGFPLSHKIGLGVGIPAALFLGLVAGWLLFRRRRRHQRKDAVAHEPPANETGQHKFDKDGFHSGTVIHEAPPNQLLEMGHSHEQNLRKWGGELDNDRAASPQPESVPYEMDASSSVELHIRAVDPGELSARTDT